jgi:hypothetical protein
MWSSGKLRVKCFKTSKVIITKCLISKHTPSICSHGMKRSSQSHAQASVQICLLGSFAHLDFESSLLSLGLQFLLFRDAGGPPRCPFLSAGKPISQWMSRSPPLHFCLGPLLQPPLKCYQRVSQDILVQKFRSALPLSLGIPPSIGWLISKMGQHSALSGGQ